MLTRKSKVYIVYKDKRKAITESAYVWAGIQVLLTAERATTQEKNNQANRIFVVGFFFTQGYELKFFTSLKGTLTAKIIFNFQNESWVW